MTDNRTRGKPGNPGKQGKPSDCRNAGPSGRRWGHCARIGRVRRIGLADDRSLADTHHWPAQRGHAVQAQLLSRQPRTPLVDGHTSGHADNDESGCAAIRVAPAEQRRDCRRCGSRTADVLRGACQSAWRIAHRKTTAIRMGRSVACPCTGKISMNNIVTINRLNTGIPGLDDVLGGGLPEFSFNLIAGPPGCGKTTLAHQMMFALATPQRPAIYFTVLGEPPLKMLRYQQQFEFFDDAAIDRTVRFISLSDDMVEGGLDQVLRR